MYGEIIFRRSPRTYPHTHTYWWEFFDPSAFPRWFAGFPRSSDEEEHATRHRASGMTGSTVSLSSRASPSLPGRSAGCCCDGGRSVLLGLLLTIVGPWCYYLWSGQLLPPRCFPFARNQSKLQPPLTHPASFFLRCVAVHRETALLEAVAPNAGEICKRPATTTPPTLGPARTVWRRSRPRH